MSCSLRIDIPQRKYKGGDTVSGFVRLFSRHIAGQDVDIGSITIELIGRSTTPGSWYRRPTSIQFLSVKESLLDGPERVFATHREIRTPSPNVWPFSLTLPLHCGAFPNDTLSRPPLVPSVSDDNSLLPASFEDASVQGTCSILYELQARLVSPLKDGVAIHKGYTNQRYIWVHRPRSIEDPMFMFHSKSATFKHRSLLLLPKKERECTQCSPTIRERLGLVLPLAKHLPKAVFTIRVQTPSDAILGQQLPLMLNVEYDLNASMALLPVFHLKEVSIHLREETSIWWLKSWNQKIVLQKKSFETQSPRVNGPLDLTTVMDTTIDHDLTPTFETFNVARSYSLKATVRLECAGKEQLVDGAYKPLTLHTREYDSQTAVAHHHEVAPITDEEETGLPPPYHEATQEPVPEYSTRAAHAGNREDVDAGQSRAGFSYAAECIDLALSGAASTGCNFFMSL